MASAAFEATPLAASLALEAAPFAVSAALEAAPFAVSAALPVALSAVEAALDAAVVEAFEVFRFAFLFCSVMDTGLPQRRSANTSGDGARPTVNHARLRRFAESPPAPGCTGLPG